MQSRAYEVVDKNKITGTDRERHDTSRTVHPLVDMRPEAIAQRKLKKLARDSEQAKQLRVFKELSAHGFQARQTTPLQKTANDRPVAQRVGILAMLSSLATYALWSTSLGTPLGILAAYLIYREASEYYRYRLGLSESEKNKILDSSCTVHIVRTQRLNREGTDYQDDHISLGVKVDGQYAKQVGFWMDKEDYKKFPFLSIRNKGEVRDDGKKFGNTFVDESGEEVIPVTHDQAASIIKRIEKDEKNPPKFSATGYNGFTCVTWAHDVLSSNGLTIKMTNKVLPPFPEALIPDSSMKKTREQ